MDEIGHRTNDYMVVGNIQGSVYVKDGKYTAEVWNPTSGRKVVQIKKADGTLVGKARIEANSTVSFKIDTENYFAYKQVKKPTITATALKDGVVTDDVNGTTEFSDTQLVELSAEEGATIYYTTDGSAPTKD